MKIKYSPCKFNEHAEIKAPADTIIKFKDENTVRIDGELYEFDNESITFPDIHSQTNGIILEAHRTDEELFITVRRFYTDTCQWDTGEYQEITE